VKIKKTIGTCRFVYNFYLFYNNKLYKEDEHFMSGKAFSVWLNNEFLQKHQSYNWIKEVSSKSVKKSIEDASTAYMNFFKGKSNFPRFKKKGKSDVKMYFVRNSQTDCFCERHRIKIPTLGWVKLKEKGYIPTTKSDYIIRSGTVSIKAGRYYVSVLVDVPEIEAAKPSGIGIGIDLGIKDLAILSDGRVYKNINKTAKLKQLNKQLKRQQRSLSRKYENLKKGEATQKRNIKRQILKLQKLYQRIDNIRTDYLNKTIAEIVKTKPSFIVIENLNVKGLMKNRHLSKAIAAQKLSEFRVKLTYKCKLLRIELRLADRFYPSSKLCHNCGNIKKDLKLNDRTYECFLCGYVKDRDFNASLNLRDVKVFSLA
jgi:putative transposase